MSRRKQIVFVVLIGLPGSGKTTVARKIMQIKNGWSCVHVCYDEILEHVQYDDRTTDLTWKSERQALIESLKSICCQIKDIRVDCSPECSTSKTISPMYIKLKGLFDKIRNEDNKIVVIIDDNMYYTSMRYSYYQLCRQLECAFAQIYMSTPMDKCICNNAKRPATQQIPIQVTSRMSTKLQVPDAQKNDWESLTFVMEANRSDEYIQEGIERIVNEAFNTPATPLKIEDTVEIEHARRTTRNNAMHKMDLLLREAVTNILTGKQFPCLTKSELTDLRPKLALAKRNILNEFKTKPFNTCDYNLSKLLLEHCKNIVT